MSSEAKLSLIEEPPDVSIGPATREPTDISMNMADDCRLELLDLDARDCPSCGANA
jgi:hypothetical protein